MQTEETGSSVQLSRAFQVCQKTLSPLSWLRVAQNEVRAQRRCPDCLSNYRRWTIRCGVGARHYVAPRSGLGNSAARSFLRAAEFAQARFPVSYYEDPASHPPACSLHHDLEWMHLLFRGLRRSDRLAIGCFVLDPASGQFAYLHGRCTMESARAFGEALLKELESL